MEYPPEISITNGEPVGYDHDIGVAVANEMKLRAHFVQTPFASIFNALKERRCDAIINSVTITAQRARNNYMVPYGKYGYTIIVPSGDPRHVTTAGTDLCGLRAGAASGSNYISLLQRLEKACRGDGRPAIKVVSFASTPDGIAALQTRKLDAYLEDAPPSEVYLARVERELQAGGAASQRPMPMGIVVSKHNPQLRTAIQKAVRALYGDGTIPGIFTTWGVPELSLR